MPTIELLADIEILKAQLQETQEELKQVRAVVYNYADFTPTCEKDGTCFVCNEYLHGKNHADDCLAALFRRVIKDGDKAAVVWLEVLDAKEATEELNKRARHLLALCLARGLPYESLKAGIEDFLYNT